MASREQARARSRDASDSGPSADGTQGSNPESGWFGTRRVAPAEKTAAVHDVFTSVARRYDLMNDLMSGGLHRLWKDRFVARTRPRPGQILLDVAGGTGDIARRWLAQAGGEGQAVLCDLTESMLRVGRDRLIDAGLAGQADLVVGNAEALPIPDRSVDTYTIAFGLRNVTRIDTALAEARRVLRPGGRFFCLEFTHPPNPGFRGAYRLYSKAVIPNLGATIARDRASYDYLIESIRRMPTQEALAKRMAAAGLDKPAFVNMTGGIVAVHSAWRL